MTINEFVDRLMIEVQDVRGERLKHAEYFTIATESLKTVEAIYRPLFDVIENTPSSDLSELTISNDTTKKYFYVGRVSVSGSERYVVDYEYAKLNTTTFIPCYGWRADGSGLKVVFNPVVPANRKIQVVAHYVHTTDYFTNPANEIDLPENYVLIALNIAKQYIYAKLAQTSIDLTQLQNLAGQQGQQNQ